jgi:hypothetical protein
MPALRETDPDILVLADGPQLPHPDPHLADDSDRCISCKC